MQYRRKIQKKKHRNEIEKQTLSNLLNSGFRSLVFIIKAENPGSQSKSLIGKKARGIGPNQSLQPSLAPLSRSFTPRVSSWLLHTTQTGRITSDNLRR